jgi:hypothetical protein
VTETRPRSPGSVGFRARRRATVAVVVAAVVVVAGAGIAIGLLLSAGGGQLRPQPVPVDNGAARLDHPQLAQVFLAAATSDVAAVASYDYRHLDDALASGVSVSAGQYRASYRAALTGQHAADIRARHVSHDFTVQRAAIGAMAAGGAQARVLVFGTDTVRSDATGGRAQAQPAVLTATVLRRGARYLITGLASDADPGLPPGTPGLAAAVQAARSDVARRVGQVRSAGVEHADGNSVVLLVAASADQQELRYEITVVRSHGTWVLARAEALTAD